MRILLTGGSGVLGRSLAPLLRSEAHDVRAPAHDELDVFDRRRLEPVLAEADAVFHLATRIPPRDSQGDLEAWQENDRLRRDATKVLVDTALATAVERVVFPSIAFVYPSSGQVDETTPVSSELAPNLRSALDAEDEVARFTARGGQGVVLRLGLLYGPGTGSDTPAERYKSFGATLRIEDANWAFLAALEAPSGIYNVVSDGERVSNARFKEITGWRPVYSSTSLEEA